MTDDEQRSPWAEIVGPCYTTASVARALGWTSPQVEEAVESLSLLELKTEWKAVYGQRNQVESVNRSIKHTRFTDLESADKRPFV